MVRCDDKGDVVQWRLGMLHVRVGMNLDGWKAVVVFVVWEVMVRFWKGSICGMPMSRDRGVEGMKSSM